MLSAKVEASEARVYTFDFRAFGMLHLTPNQDTARLLNRDDRPSLALTQAMLYRPGYDYPPKQADFQSTLDFVAIPLERILWVYGGNPGPARGIDFELRRLYVLFHDHYLRGDIKMAPGMRFSDYFATSAADKPFQILYNVGLYAGLPNKKKPEGEGLEHFDFVTLNLHNASGIFDVKTEVKDDDG